MRVARLEFAGQALTRTTGCKVGHKAKAVTDVKESIRAFILTYAANRGLTELKDDEPILTSNIIDSLGSFEMILFLEKTFHLTIEDADMDPDNFQTLNHVERFVLGKLGKADGKAKHHIPVPLTRTSRERRHRG
jgi:acyl carrier protein